MKVRKAVVTAAGWGTRFLPVTKAQPKEMLPLVDKPIIQYAVEEAFALFLPDDVFVGNGPVIGQLIEAHGELGGCVLAVERVKKEEVGRYGIIAPKQIGPRLYQVLDLVEKPSPQQAPSDLAIVGRYVLEPKIFAALEATTPGRGQEIQLTDGLRQLLPGEKIYAWGF